MALTNWYWGCCGCDESSGTAEGFCPCCKLDIPPVDNMPPSIEVVISGIANRFCGQCVNYNGTFVLDVSGGCCYTLFLPNGCFTGNGDRLEVCWEVYFRQPPALPQCGVWARLTLFNSGCEDSISWATVTDQGFLNGCCDYSTGITLPLHDVFGECPAFSPACLSAGSTATITAICP